MEAAGHAGAGRNAAVSLYQGRRACLTTRHGKERALALPFRVGLGMELIVSAADTDRLGTFSGEVERTEDAITTCRRKAMLGLELTGMALGIASEASFGPHPNVPLLAAGLECLLFLDSERDLCIVEHCLELRTNYAQRHFRGSEDPGDWLQRIGFPSHAVIVSPAATDAALLFKGIRSVPALREAMQRCRDADREGRVLLQTDMRAHLNPTRLRSIRRLGITLARRLRRTCPDCGAPGWGLARTVSGLPCRACGTPTALVLSEVWGCVSCGAERLLPRRDGRLTADPGRCDWCNP